MIGWLLAGGGVFLAAVGTTLAVGAAAVSRLELSRWVSQRLRGAALATELLSAPDRVFGAAAALAILGTVTTGVGAAALLAPLDLWVELAAVMLAVPLFLALTYALPRATGRRWAEPIMRVAAPWLSRLARLAGPLIPTGPPPGRADLRSVLRARDPDARLRGDEVMAVAGLIAFTERPVKDVMTPRTEIVAVAEGAPVAEAATIFRESGYSRIPVYRGSLDQIVGMVHAFDLLTTGKEQALALRRVTITPGSRRCVDLLLEMQRERRQFAVILDEFGGTAGIATLEDLLEELIGEIFDEYDRADAPAVPELEILEIDATEPSEALAARFGVALPVPSQTVGGLLAGALGRIPRAGERIVVAGLEFDVLAATPTRAERLVVRRAGTLPIVPRQPNRPDPS